MPPHRKRKSRSPSCSHDRDWRSPSPKHRRSKDNDKLEFTLKSLETLQNDVFNCNSPLALNESRFEQKKTVFELDHDVDYGAISLVVSEDPAFESVNRDQAFQPSNEAELSLNEATKLPNMAINPPNKASEPSTNTQLPSSGRTNLVNTQFKQGRRQPYFSPTSRSNNSPGCMLGWGATCQGKSTNGKWSSQESTHHINLLELKAAFLALKTFLGPV